MSIHSYKLMYLTIIVCIIIYLNQIFMYQLNLVLKWSLAICTPSVSLSFFKYPSKFSLDMDELLLDDVWLSY